MRKKGLAIIAAMAMVLTGLMLLVNPIAADGEDIDKKWEGNTDWIRVFLGEERTVEITAVVPYLPMTLEDHLPEGLSYVVFSFMVDGESKTPTVADHVVSYDFESTGTFEIQFTVLYDSAPTAPLPETVLNWAYLVSDGCPKADDDARITLDPYCNFHKKGTLLESGDDLVIEKNENAIWTFHIWVRNMYTEAFWGEDVTLYNVVVTDRLAAELEVDDPPAPEYPEGTTLTYPRKGNIKITWTIGTLLPGERVDLYMQISTRMKGKKQQYTSCGTYEWNSGAVLKFNFGAEDGVQLSAHSEKYWVNVPGTWPGTPPPPPE